MHHTRVELSATQAFEMEVARTAFMNQCPFFAHYYYSEMRECPTPAVPTAATDGRTIYYNPEYFMSIKPAERVFALAHEVYHVIYRHVQRMHHYRRAGEVDTGLPYIHELMNCAADYVINADLIAQGVGTCNPAWLYDPAIKPEELAEDVYKKLFDRLPPRARKQGGSGGKGQGQSGQGQPGKGQPSQGQPGHDPSTYGAHGGGKGKKEDKTAAANGGRFDDVLEPSTDPVTGKEDLPDKHEFEEAIARAAAAAKAMGNLPASFKRLVDEILAPQVNWREHLRMLFTGKVGQGRETWDTPNRRRLALNPIIYMPGRKGFGADTVVVGVDTSGSISEKEIAAFLGEIGGIIADVRPKRVILMACDAAVQQMDEARTLDELELVRQRGLKGGGGTDFRPVFDRIAEAGIRPDALVYITDMMGRFPESAPAYPVIWCASTDIAAPFGDVVRIRV